MVRPSMELESTDKNSLKLGTKKDGTKYSVRTNRDKFFFPSEWMIFYDSLRKRQQMIFDFMIQTGARINEVRHVQVQDCDLERKNVVLRVTKIKARKGEKNPRPRIISISSQFAKHLKHYITDKKLSGYDYLFRKKNKTPVSKEGIHLAMKRTMIRAKIRDYWMFSLHNIRKTHGNWLKALGIDGAEICTRLGHDYNTFLHSYSSPDIFSFKDKQDMKLILGDLYQR